MPFLSVRLKLEGEEPKSFEVLSLEQIVGKHLTLPLFCKKLCDASKGNPQKYITSSDFCVFSPNKTLITHAPWTLIFGEKGENRQLGFLLIGNKLFGVTPLAIGLKMQKSAKKDGPDKIEAFIRKLTKSIIEEPEQWTRIITFSNPEPTKMEN